MQVKVTVKQKLRQIFFVLWSTSKSLTDYRKRNLCRAETWFYASVVDWMLTTSKEVLLEDPVKTFLKNKTCTDESFTIITCRENRQGEFPFNADFNTTETLRHCWKTELATVHRQMVQWQIRLSKIKKKNNVLNIQFKTHMPSSYTCNVSIHVWVLGFWKTFK